MKAGTGRSRTDTVSRIYRPYIVLLGKMKTGKKLQENSQEQERKQVAYFPDRLVGSRILPGISRIAYPVFPFLLVNSCWWLWVPWMAGG